MPLEKQFNTFVKGLITEASPLTFPANASLDEDNLVLNADGSRQRRLGIDYELNYGLIPSGLTKSILDRAKKDMFRWDSPGGLSTLSIGIIRIYDRLWFINLLSSAPSSSLLNNGLPMPISGLANGTVDITFINTYAVLVSPDLENTIVLSYDIETNRVYQEATPLFVRDLWGVDDGLSASERPVTLTDTHHYNLLNQGWNSNIKTAGVVAAPVANPTPTPQVTTGHGLNMIFGTATGNTGSQMANITLGWNVTTPKTVPNPATAINDTKDKLGVYPSNSDVWSLGKTSDPSSASFEKYDPNILARNSYDNLYCPKASLIIDAYNRGQSRRNSTGLQTLFLDKELGRCTTVCSYASRVFYSGVSSNISGGDSLSPNYSSYIFFTQVVTSKNKIPNCYQEADPTSPEISDIVDTDGGTIQIPEATNIVKLIPALGSLLVCAENGIWEIYGDTGGFKATSFQSSKVTGHGVTSASSIVEVNGSVLLWGKAGIFLLAPDNMTGRYKAENISLTTIQTYYNSISELARTNAKAIYNAKENTVRWLYNDSAEYSQSTGLDTYNKELILDLTLKAFYPTTIGQDDNSPYVSSYISMPGYSVAYITEGVAAGTNTVLVTSLDEVVKLSPDYSSQQSSFKFLTVNGTSFTLSSYRNTSFYDWKTQSTTGYDYSSYLVTGYEISQDLMRNKQTPYIFCYFNKTEDGFETGIGGGLEYTNPSSCYVQAQWNWTNSVNGNKWGTPFQAYRLSRNYTPEDNTDNFDNGDNVIVSKNKLRGSGKSLSLKFISETGKDLQLLGWAYPLTGDKVV